MAAKIITFTEEARRALERGMDQLAGLGVYGFISKPWDNEVLRCLLRAAAAQRRWERDRGLYAEIQQISPDWVWART